MSWNEQVTANLQAACENAGLSLADMPADWQSQFPWLLRLIAISLGQSLDGMPTDWQSQIPWLTGLIASAPLLDATLPTVAQVLFAVQFGAVENPSSGTFVPPTAAQMVHGQSCGVAGNVVGTQYVPAAGNVLSGVSTGTTVGTYPTTATSQAAQLVTDQAAVLAAAAQFTGMILGQTGTRTLTLTPWSNSNDPYAGGSRPTIQQDFGVGFTTPVVVASGPNVSLSYISLKGGSTFTVANVYYLRIASYAHDLVSLTRTSWTNAAYVQLDGSGLSTAGIEQLLAQMIVGPVQTNCVIDVSGGTYAASMVGNATIGGGDGAQVVNTGGGTNWAVQTGAGCVNPTVLATSKPTWTCASGTYPVLWCDGSYWYISTGPGSTTNSYKGPNYMDGPNGNYVAQGAATAGPITVAGATAGLTTVQAYALRLAYSTRACTVTI